MAVLNSVLAPTRISRAASEWSTIKKEWPNGRVTTKRMWSAKKRSWEVEWDGISLTQFNSLETFFDTHKGGYAVFQFTDTHTGVTYDARFVDDELKRTNARNTVRGLYRVTVKIEEDKS
jgi:hypothetical protein